MGYTNYHEQHRNFTHDEWDEIRTFTQSIIDIAASASLMNILHNTEPSSYDGAIPLGDASGEEKPLITSDYIMLNGVDEHGHESFCVKREKPEHDDFCKTAQKPYDQVCMAI